MENLSKQLLNFKVTTSPEGLNQLVSIDAEHDSHSRPVLPDLYSVELIHPLKGRKHHLSLSAVVEKPLTWYLERAGVAFSMSGAAVCSLPASMLNTFATNAFFLTGDLFLLALWIRERRFWLIVQNAVFAALAAYGVVNNAGGIL